MPRNYQTQQDVEQAIKEKKKKYETTSLKPNDEKAILKDIEMLQKVLPEMKKLQTIEPELKKIRDERKKISADLDIVNKLIDDRDQKINEGKQLNQAVQEKKSEVREKASVLSKDLDEANEALRNLYSAKDKLRESYFKQLYEFELQNDEIRWIKNQINQQKKQKRARDDLADKIAKKKLEIENRPNPNQKKIDTCDHLVQYCHKLKVQQGLVPQTSEEVAKQTETQMINDFNRQDLEQKLKEGKIQMAVKQTEDAFSVNKKNKGKKAKTQQSKQAEVKTFNIDFVMISKFGLVNVSPPLKPEDLDSKITELQELIKKFEREGQQELDKERESILANIEQIVLDDIDAEIKREQEEEDEEEEEEKKQQEKPKPKKGYNYKPKDEFFDGSDSDENEITQAAYAKPSRGGGQQVNRGGRRGGRGGRGNADFDEDDFPTL